MSYFVFRDGRRRQKCAYYFLCEELLFNYRFIPELRCPIRFSLSRSLTQ
jgi:hypothetical protein